MLTICLHLVGQIAVYGQGEESHEEHYYVSSQEIPTFTVEQNGLTAEYPDWSQITFSSLGNTPSGGEFNSNLSLDRALGYSLSRSWSEGDNPAQFMKLGDFENSSLGNLTLEHVLGNSMTEIDTVPLSAFRLIEKQTISDLVEAIPQLQAFKVREVEPILELVGSSYANVEIAMLKNMGLGDLSFDNLDLEEFSIDSIPELTSTSLSNFKKWRDSYLEEVPGLWDLPLNYVFEEELGSNSTQTTTYTDSETNVEVTVTPGLIGIVDIAYGAAESRRENTISGSDVEGFNVPCDRECAYVELADWSYGKQWISGKYQDVRGGHGILGAYNGGREPTGRLPFGNQFKVVVWDVDESEGRVDMVLFLRICMGWLGCTPYAIGPIPFLTYHEKDTMFVGLIDPIDVEVNHASISTPVPVSPTESTTLPAIEGVDLINPLAGAIVTSEYGYRNTGIPNASTFHAGIDLAYSSGDSRYPGQIVAAGDGIITYAGRDNSGCGSLILIEHPSGLRTGYCHMSEIYVRAQDFVVAGQVIGLVGAEGVGSGPHLHFMTYENNRKVNPRKYIIF